MTSACEILENPQHIGVMWKTVSEACNLACDYCYYSTCGGVPGKINRIDSVVLEKFIKEYMAITKGVASFAWQGGEPLLAGLDFFEEVVRLQAKYAPPRTIISNSLQTNGTLITERFAKFFKKYNFLIGVSLDGPEELHDSRRVTSVGGGSFKNVMRGIEHLRNHNVPFNILTVIHDGNVGKAKELMEFFEKENFTHVQFIPCMDFRAQEPNKPTQYLITPEQYGQFLCDVFDIWYKDGHPKRSVRFFDNMLSVYLHQEAELCTQRETCPKTIILEQNGDAYPCDFYIEDSYKLGNVGTDNLLDILANPKYDEFLQMKPTLPDQCKSCEFLKLCHGGCPRNRMWNQSDNGVSPDYFCQSYKQIYRYADSRMETVASNIKLEWLKNHLKAGHKMPSRNDTCLCGSGKKFKNCCEALVPELGA